MRSRRSRSRLAAKPATLRSVLGLLLLLQVVAGFGAHILFEWPPAAALVSLAYLVLAWRLGRALADALPRRLRTRFGALGIAVVWQLPALLGSINILRELMGWTPYDGNSDLLDFAMETWQIAVVPLLSLLPQDVRWWGFSPFYLGLCAAAPVLVVGFIVAALWPTRVRRRSRISLSLAETAATLERAPEPAPVAEEEAPAAEAGAPAEEEAPAGPAPPAPPRAAAVEPPPGGTGPWQPVRRWQDAVPGKGGRRRPK